MPYPAERYSFPELVGLLLGCDDLRYVHLTGLAEPGEGDQGSEAHKLYYEGFHSMVEDAYRRFVTEQICPMYAGDICVQRIPTFRVSIPGCTAVAEYHTDAEYNHQPGVLNYWVPLTPAYSSNTVWIERQPGRGDYRPAELLPGEMVRFDGVRLRHGNQENVTPHSRVSFDFRVIEHRLFLPTAKHSVTIGMSLGIGPDSYYSVVRDGKWLS